MLPSHFDNELFYIIADNILLTIQSIMNEGNKNNSNNNNNKNRIKHISMSRSYKEDMRN